MSYAFMGKMTSALNGLRNSAKPYREIGNRLFEGGTHVLRDGSQKAGNFFNKTYEGWYNHLKENPKSLKDIYSPKAVGLTTAFSGAMYGLSAVMTDDGTMDGGDRMAHYTKHAMAGAADVTADLALTGVAAGLSMLGPLGAVAGGGLMAYNLLGGFFGIDAGSGVMNFMDYADTQYEKQRRGPKFPMTQNTSMAMQRQVQNLHASGSNLGEMMHN